MHDQTDTDVICGTRALTVAFIPVPAGIQGASHGKRAAAGLDSRRRGNDPCFEDNLIQNGTSTVKQHVPPFSFFGDTPLSPVIFSYRQ